MKGLVHKILVPVHACMSCKITLSLNIHVQLPSGAISPSYYIYRGAWWLSGRVLDLRPRSCGFKPHQRHYFLSFSKTPYPLLSTGSTQEDPSRHD